MKISLIAAMDSARGIGHDNQMSWHLPDDFKHFKSTTMGKPILMGRNTAVSMGRALPGRENWVLSRNPQPPFEGQHMFTALDEAIAHAQHKGIEELCIIGGGQVYTQSMELATDLYITHIHTQQPADTYFPAIDPDVWLGSLMFSHGVDDRHAFAFDVYHYTRR